ncbi:hypothetical protein [Exiguobacterium sp. MH3]|uniref:hypothetical protein n=1 Tax=Exiguobacterium sp. MH3 TaxID=1399115 RepID=UPI0003C3B57B|nr:hypothetical protein [Exiguobacterium sp. MH3]AHA31426.1 hypothetical protein U719_08820 [Exiguobacterium sp. MH3]
MKQQTFIGIVLISLGLLFSLDPFRHQPPAPDVTIENREAKVYLGTYTWSGLFLGETADAKVGPVEQVKKKQGERVAPEEQMSILFRDGPHPKTVTVELWSVTNGKKLRTFQDAENITLPTTHGKYVYQIRAGWEEGNGYFAIPIEVE